MVLNPPKSRIRFWRAYGGWWKSNLHLGLIITVFQIIGASFQSLSSSEPFSLIPDFIIGLILLAPLFSLILITSWYWQYEWRRFFLLPLWYGEYRNDNKGRTLLLDDTSESKLWIIIQISPAVEIWAIRLKTSAQCALLSIVTRDDYTHTISDDCKMGLVYGRTLEQEIVIQFHIQARGQGLAQDAIIQIGTLANNKAKEAAVRNQNWMNLDFNILEIIRAPIVKLYDEDTQEGERNE